MAVIENAAASPEALAAWRASMRGMDRAELMAQKLVQRGAEHALAALQGAGATPESCAAMLASLREGLIEIHTIAVERSIQLVGYSDQEPTTAAVPAREIVAAVQQHGETPKAFDAFLCRAWRSSGTGRESVASWSANGSARRMRLTTMGQSHWTGSKLSLMSMTKRTTVVAGPTNPLSRSVASALSAS